LQGTKKRGKEEGKDKGEGCPNSGERGKEGVTGKGGGARRYNFQTTAKQGNAGWGVSPKNQRERGGKQGKKGEKTQEEARLKIWV